MLLDTTEFFLSTSFLSNSNLLISSLSGPCLLCISFIFKVSSVPSLIIVVSPFWIGSATIIVPSSTSTEITSTVTGQGTGTGSISITNVTLDTDGSGNLLNTGTGTGTVTFDSTHPITIDPHPLTQGVCVKIQENYNSGTPEVTAWHMDDTVSGTTNRKWRVIMGYQNKNNDCDVNETNFPKGARIDATVYTYCYFDKHRFLDTSLSNTECLENGFSWEYDPSTNAYKCFRFTSSGTRTTLKETGGRENLTADDCGKITTQGTCELMGCTWTVSGGSGTCSHP